MKQFFEALKSQNLVALGQTLTADITLYPPAQVRSSSSPRVQGLPAILAYIQAGYTRYPNITGDEPQFYPRPKGWAMRYTSHWPLSDGSSQSLTGAMLFHFQGAKIHQIGIQLNDERWQKLLKS